MAWNWLKALGGGAGGALGGAGLGATLGSVVPGIGTAIGAGLGALGGAALGGVSGGAQGSPWEQSPNKYSKPQQQALNSYLQMGNKQLQNPYAGFEPIAQYATNRFKSQAIPGLAERFTGVGGSDTRGSSDLLGMLSGAESEFNQGLGALRSQYGQQNQNNALQLLQLGLSPQKENIYFGEKPSVGGQLLEQGGGLVGNYLAGGGKFGLGGQGPVSSKDQAILKLLQHYKGMGAF